jgi:hypothetical protein
MNQNHDCIYTILDYYDGVRHGLTSLAGQPYVYQSLWADQRDEDDTFLLQPID